MNKNARKKMKNIRLNYVNNLSLNRLETEEKYGQVVEERELFKEKEKVFMETFDAFTRLNKIIKDKVYPKLRDPVIDIPGEDHLGGSPSSVMCDKCNYKTSIIFNLSEHKHTDNQIPCELCKYSGKNIEDYQRHVEMKHAAKNGKSSKKEQLKKSVNNPKNNNVKIPCDLCEFTSISAEDFIKHIETNHQEKINSGNEMPSYECDKCDYMGTGEFHFKKHLEAAECWGNKEDRTFEI